MAPDVRLEAAEAFWLDKDSPDVEVQRAEAVVAIARALNFRSKSVQSLPVERRARALARLSDVSDAVATRILIAHHFRSKRPLMGAFLDALGIPHDSGVITDDEGIPAPDVEKLAAAVTAVRSGFPDAEVTLYLRTLLALDEDTWKNLASLVDTAG